MSRKFQFDYTTHRSWLMFAKKKKTNSALKFDLILTSIFTAKSYLIDMCLRIN